MEPTETERLAEALAEIERLRARILELEAVAAVMRGTVMGTLQHEEPFSVIHDVAPTTPRE